MSDRYNGKPLLLLLESYVLRAIGKIEAGQEGRLVAMEPQLRQVFKQQGSWHEVVAATMDFPENMPEMIRGMWTQNQKIAQQHGDTLTPQRFAEMFVDANFPQ